MRDAERLDTMCMDGQQFMEYHAQRERAACVLQAHWRGRTERRDFSQSDTRPQRRQV